MAIKPDHGIDMAVNFHKSISLPFITALLIAVVQIAGCSNDSPAPVKNKPAPEFSLQNMQGRSVDFPQQFRDQIVIISFWADWCPSCYKEMRDLKTIYKRYKKQGLSILAINIKQDRETAMAFIDDLNLSYDLLLDSNGDIAKHYAVSSLPAAFIIDRNGDLNTRVLGETPAEVFDQILRAIL